MWSLHAELAAVPPPAATRAADGPMERPPRMHEGTARTDLTMWRHAAPHARRERNLQGRKPPQRGPRVRQLRVCRWGCQISFGCALERATSPARLCFSFVLVKSQCCLLGTFVCRRLQQRCAGGSLRKQCAVHQGHHHRLRLDRRGAPERHPKGKPGRLMRRWPQIWSALQLSTAMYSVPCVDRPIRAGAVCHCQRD